ncbi:helix-turn-helix transcriptional regulator [Undibacterium curvum]|uniref:Helix-turn-helix transcriptional regulator n=1 Tax=Undibacterium curvum TaxID=2762294 RepID=A0ABR7A1M2_9BURK|nr:helix-turn-helix transcriptional regulator [Undibacterium curvum]MBC3930651.1 helix-turn-helix transcriptional regulator [Undibacterium curvum]
MPVSKDLAQLSEQLLKLGRLSRSVVAADFLSQAVSVVREVLEFPRGWWGLGSAPGEGLSFAIHQAEYLGLPSDFSTEWQKIACMDSYAAALSERGGEVQCYVGGDYTDLPPEIIEFDRRYDLHHAMGLSLADGLSGHGFFIVVYRGQGTAPFSVGEADLFLHLMRHIVQLWYFALQDALSASERLSCALLASADGRVLYAGPELCELIYAHWPEWNGIHLPPALCAHFDHLPSKMRLKGSTIKIRAKDEHIWLTCGESDRRDFLLSPREQRVAHLFARGLSYKEIARLLNLKPSTVRTYLRDAYLRLRVKNKVELGDWLDANTAQGHSS